MDWERWEQRILREIGACRERLRIASSLESTLQNLVSPSWSPVGHIHVTIERPDPFEDLVAGSEGASSPIVHTYELDETISTRAKIKWWPRGEIGQGSSDVDQQLFKLVSAFWKPGLRSEPLGVLDVQKSRLQPIITRTLRFHASRGDSPVLLFSDLDDFGEVNKQHDYDEGDRVIAELVGVLDREVSDEAILLHHSGDQFLILLPDATHEKGIRLASRVNSAVTGHDFGIDEPQLSSSTGIAVAEDHTVTFQQLLSEAGQASKLAKEEKPGATRCSPRGSAGKVEEPPGGSFQFSQCLVKSGAFGVRPFASPWLNVLSAIVSERVGQAGEDLDIQEAADEFLQWAKLSVTDSLDPPAGIEWGRFTKPEVTTMGIVSAICHGIYRAMADRRPSDVPEVNLVVRYAQNLSRFTVLMDGGDPIFKHAGGADEGEEFTYGGAILSPEGGLPFESAARSLLVKVGHKTLEDSKLLSSLFSDVIVVDDRPTRGGGLPDFWEATLGMLIDRVEWNPNLHRVFLLGEEDYAQQTFTYLQEMDGWPDRIEYLRYKTGMDAAKIRQTVEQLDAGNGVTVAHSAGDVIEDLSDALTNRYEFNPPSEMTTAEQAPVLQRSIEPQPIRLEIEQGCRVQTVEEAYPTVLEIARNAELDKIRDQAGRELTELVDFRLTVNRPDEGQIPAFYKEEAEDLEAYYEDQFEEPKGLFRSELEREGQLDVVLNHIAEVIQSDSPFASRRAVLIVPHRLDDGDEVHPLGLVSIRLIPRFVDQRVRIHVSFVWRTVEALVGFPYSLYASVRFADHLISLLGSRLSPRERDKVSLGYVNYIANSLHIFADPYGENIARRIVNEASL